MYDNMEIKVLEQVYLHPGIHKRELSRKLGVGMPSVDHAIKKVDKLLKKEKSGNQIRYYLDYSQDALIPALYAVEHSRFEKLPAVVKLSIKDFLQELTEKPMMVMLFGSYAKNTYTKKSDIDILLVFQNFPHAERIENTAKRISMRTNIGVSAVYLDYNSFRDSFHNPTKRFFKELKEKKILLEGIEEWRRLRNEES